MNKVRPQETNWQRERLAYELAEAVLHEAALRKGSEETKSVKLTRAFRAKTEALNQSSERLLYVSPLQPSDYESIHPKWSVSLGGSLPIVQKEHYV